MEDETPQYTHDCDSCTFLGRFDDLDLYYCPQAGRPTVIARCGNDGPEYTSGLPAVGQIPALTEAARRAEATGLLNADQRTGRAGGQTIGEALAEAEQAACPD